jgi:hypothetical protein
MALRNLKRIVVRDWFGLQTFASENNLAMGWWNGSSNVVVSNDGSAACLRSPLNLSQVPSVSGDGVTRIPSIFCYEKSTGPIIMFDGDTGANVTAYANASGTNAIQLSEAEAKVKMLTINNRLYRLGATFTSSNGTAAGLYSVGIAAPAAAPSISYVAGGSGSIAVGVTASYAYRNSTTGHISVPSPVSNDSGVTSTDLSLRIPTVASVQPGVDGIVFFISQDGGSVRYLYIDTNGDPVVNSNATANVDISVDIIDNLDTLTPETVYNTVPPQDISPYPRPYFMFRFRDRICLCDFREAEMRQLIQYNVFENCYYGVPWESWFPTNVIAIPSKADAARCGIETPLGALVLGELDAYLIRGELTDKIAGPQSSISITESMQSLNWGIGTRSPFTLVSSPFGEIWWDQHKRIQLWDRSGFPTEIGLPIRTTLAAALDTPTARQLADACWFQDGDDGGFYVLTYCASGSNNTAMAFIGVYRDPETGQMKTACATSDFVADSIAVVRTSTDSTSHCVIGQTDRLKEILNLNLEGGGFASGSLRYFSTIVGAEDEYAYFHSLRFDATGVLGVSISVSNLDGNESNLLTIDQDGESFYAPIDVYGFRKMVTFTFSNDDTERRDIQNLRVAYSRKTRLL